MFMSLYSQNRRKPFYEVCEYYAEKMQNMIIKYNKIATGKMLHVIIILWT